ncbi:MAG TPA: UPF0158 family protein [Thermoanaerobaculia bacterium]|nr:UPF0158 family protein [Thermoanaerobaculia bacterium]
MPVTIDWEGLTVAFENRSQKITHFFDRQTGDVVQVLAADAERHAALLADPRYAALPKDAGERSRGDLEAFAAHCEDADCRRDLKAALAVADPRDAFRAALLKHPKEEAHFFQFKERQARERALAWLREQGVTH